MFGLGAGIGAAGDAMQSGDEAALRRSSAAAQNQQQLDNMRTQQIDVENRMRNAKALRDNAAIAAPQLDMNGYEMGKAPEAPAAPQAPAAPAPQTSGDAYNPKPTLKPGQPAYPPQQAATPTQLPYITMYNEKDVHADLQRKTPEENADIARMAGEKIAAEKALGRAGHSDLISLYSRLQKAASDQADLGVRQKLPASAPLPAASKGVDPSQNPLLGATTNQTHQFAKPDLKAQAVTSPADANSALAANTGAPQIPDRSPVKVADVAPYLSSLEQKNGMPPGILSKMLEVESGGVPRQGPVIPGQNYRADGYFQWIPSTAKQQGIQVGNFASEATGAAVYLTRLAQKLGGWDKALAAYGGGFVNGQITPNGQAYVSKYASLAQGQPPQAGQPTGVQQPTAAQYNAPAGPDIAPGFTPGAQQASSGQQGAYQQYHAMLIQNAQKQLSTIDPRTSEGMQAAAALSQQIMGYKASLYSGQIFNVAGQAAAGDQKAMSVLSNEFNRVSGSTARVWPVGNGQYAMVTQGKDGKPAVIPGSVMSASDMATSLRSNVDTLLQQQLIQQQMEIRQATAMSIAKEAGPGATKIAEKQIEQQIGRERNEAQGNAARDVATIGANKTEAHLGPMYPGAGVVTSGGKVFQIPDAQPPSGKTVMPLRPQLTPLPVAQGSAQSMPMISGVTPNTAMQIASGRGVFGDALISGERHANGGVVGIDTGRAGYSRSKMADLNQ